MIKNQTPLSMAESLDYIEEKKDAESEVKKFIKKFVKIDSEDAVALRKKIEALEFMKMKPEYVVKIIDTLPEDAESLNKIFIEVGLDEDETKKILDIVGEFK